MLRFSGGRLTPGAETMRSPTRMVPSSGERNPAMSLSVVVLPQPEGPSSETRLPWGMASDRLSTAIRPPKRLVNFASSTTAIPIPWPRPYAGRAGATRVSSQGPTGNRRCGGGYPPLPHDHAQGNHPRAQPIARGLRIAEKITRQRRHHDDRQGQERIGRAQGDARQHPDPDQGGQDIEQEGGIEGRLGKGQDDPPPDAGAVKIDRRPVEQQIGDRHGNDIT